MPPKSKTPPPRPPKPASIKSPHTPGPWAPLPGPEGSLEVWTVLPKGNLHCLAKIEPGKTAAVDAALMAAAPQLAHEVRAATALLEKIIAIPEILDTLVESTKNTDIEAILLHRLGCLRRLATVVGPALTEGGYEPSPAEARWHVPEHAYRAKESHEDVEE